MEKQYFILRQASYKGTTYFLGALTTPDGEDFTNDFAFLEKVDKKMVNSLLKK
ncbi:MAG: hypothetical protein L6V81_04075 [Clostridium sp.]|nr:MAG: hypothetical protein L6V81_04075 [Clostridium sp.]